MQNIFIGNRPFKIVKDFWMRRAQALPPLTVSWPITQTAWHPLYVFKAAKLFLIPTICTVAAILSAPVSAETNDEALVADTADHPHHVSILLGGTHIDEVGETAFTAGIDYEYRVNDFVGLGFVAEQAFGKIDATTILAVADLHLTKGLVIQVGPGIEFVDDRRVGVARLGAIYEFELANRYTVSPQLHYDATSHHDSIIFAIALGRYF